MVTLIVTRHFLDSGGRRDMDHTLDYHRITNLCRLELDAAAERSIRARARMAQLMHFVERSISAHSSLIVLVTRAPPRFAA
jgi:hypothetical protein